MNGGSRVFPAASVVSPLLALCVGVAHALDAQVTVGGKELVLNGEGVRKATIFDVRVYRAGLYLEKKSKDPEAILASDGVKEMRLEFLRDVGADKIREAWQTGFEKHCKPDCKRLEGELKKLQAQMSDMSKGDRMAFTFYPDQLVATVRGKAREPIAGKRFGDILLATWLGDHTELKDLKKELLGK